MKQTLQGALQWILRLVFHNFGWKLLSLAVAVVLWALVASEPELSTFATVRLRTYKTKGAGSRTACLAMAFKLVESAQNHWRKLNGSTLLPEVIAGVVFKDGTKLAA